MMYVSFDDSRFNFICSLYGPQECTKCKVLSHVSLYKRYNQSLYVCVSCIDKFGVIIDAEKQNHLIDLQKKTINSYIIKHSQQRDENGDRIIAPLLLEHYLEPEVWFSFVTNKFVARFFEVRQECIICKKNIIIEFTLFCENNRCCQKCNDDRNFSCKCNDITNRLKRK